MSSDQYSLPASELAFARANEPFRGTGRLTEHEEDAAALTMNRARVAPHRADPFECQSDRDP
jgi:hypothetical protein